MSRFSGWTSAAFARLGSIEQPGTMIKPVNKLPKTSPDYVGKISAALNILGIKHEREYKFLHDRRFRFDIAIPEKRFACEFEGGIFTNGAHTRGRHYASDVKKYNLATMHNWKLLRYTTLDTKKTNWEFEIAKEIELFINKE